MLKFRGFTKGSMKKIFSLLITLIILTGCAESIALLGTSASNGKIVQSTFNSAVSYGIKKQTGKTPIEHAIAYAEEKNPEKKGTLPIICEKNKLGNMCNCEKTIKFN